jgi:hypothetical protein
MLTERSGPDVTVVVTEAALLETLGSVASEDTVAVMTEVPVVDATTVRVNDLDAPGARELRKQVAPPPILQ